MSVDRSEEAALPTEPKAPEKSLGQLFAELTSDLSTLVRKEVELAKVETKDELSRAGKAGGMLGGGACAGWFALLFLSFALAWLLDEWMHTALAFLIVGLVYAVVAAVLVIQGRTRLQSVNPVPSQTVETIKEDVQWARAQRS
jgi:F0F1-type ATP synthase assembly protein I